MDQGKVYTLGAMGDLICLDAATGKVQWSRNYIRDFGAQPPIWGFSAAPLVDGRKLIVIAGGSENRCVLALDKETGREIWRSLEAGEPGYSAPVIFEFGGARQLIIWNPKGLYGLDPETGQAYWSREFPVRNGPYPGHPHLRSRPEPPVRERLLRRPSHDAHRFRPAFSSASLEGPEHQRDRDRRTALPHVHAGPGPGHLYGVDSYGQLRCLDALTGQRVWETLKATGKGRWWNAFLVRHQNRFIILNEQGEMIFARLTPEGYQETSRTTLIEPVVPIRRRLTVWSHPAFANRSIYARNNRSIVCADLSAR